jgi:soluble lytic murein transglycosylase-like protein
MVAKAQETTMKSAALAVLATVFTFNCWCTAVHAGQQNACEREMARAAQVHAVPLGVLYAVGLTETGRGDSMRPNALNIEGRATYDNTLADAVRTFHAAQASGKKLIDVGCMQINSYYHAKSFASLQDMFDPAKNVDYAARFLRQLRAREGSWTMAVARYYAGPNNDSGQKRYICRVIANMVTSGFGTWTPEARSLCGPGRVGGD